MHRVVSRALMMALVGLLLGGLGSGAVGAAGRAGQLDTSFGSGGVATADFAGRGDIPQALTVLSNGKILVGGYANTRDGSSRFALARFETHGGLDPTFGSNGRVLTDLGGTANDAYGLAIQADGRIVLAGTADGGPCGNDFALVRYRPDGTLDPSFGSAGIVQTNFPGRDCDFDVGAAVALQADGKIVVGGWTYVGSTPEREHADFALARYHPDGTLDGLFGVSGLVVTDLGGDDFALALAIEPNDSIVLVGSSADLDSGQVRLALARYRKDGTLDPAFGRLGLVVSELENVDAEARGVVLHKRRGLVVAGYAYDYERGENDLLLARYGRSGRLERVRLADFGGDEAGLSLTQQPDGRLVVGGYASEAAGPGARHRAGRRAAPMRAPTGADARLHFLIARFAPSLKLDTTFGARGVIATSVGNVGDNLVLALATQRDGNVVAAGPGTLSIGTADFTLLRLLGR